MKQKNITNSLLTMQKRLLILIISITFLFFALFVRLGYIQIIKGKEYSARAVDQWTRDLPYEAVRGNILDANGIVLADNQTSWTVYVRPSAVTDKDAVISILARILELDSQSLAQKLGGKPVSDITIKRDVGKEEVDALKSSKVEGIYFSINNIRNYPYDHYLTQVLGYVGADGDGQSGLEAYYNKYLKGTDGQSLTQTDIRGDELEDNFTYYIPAIDGLDIVTTIDINIQTLVEDAVADALAEYNSLSASAIVLNAKTGAIVACATAPSFDLNAPPRDNIALLNSLSKNKLIVDVFEPGSTFKIFTTAAAIEEGKASTSDRFVCPGFRMVDGERIKCWRTKGHGSISLIEGINKSCNCVFMDLAGRVSTDTFYKYIKNFGLNSTTGIDFFSESRGILMPQKTVRNVDLARIGFGQAIAVTPLQLASGVAAVVNGGKLMRPYFVSEVRSNSGQIVSITQPKEIRKVISEQTSAQMRQLLEDVVHTGSGNKAFVEGYRIGGKTGTAQKYADGQIARGKYVSSFIGFAPADDPEYVTLFMVDEPSGYVYYGSLVAGPYVGDIFKGIFIYKRMRPVNLVEDILVSKPSVVVPSVGGMSASDAIATLEKLGLQVEVAGENGLVISQTPPPNTLVRKKDIVLIRLES